MVIPGLHGFVKMTRPIVTQPHDLYDTRLVVDGNNLINRIAQHSNLNFEFGGDYIRFATEVEDYFKCLQECCITPIIIYDGGNNPVNRNLETLKLRLNQKVDSALNVVRNGSASYSILPLLCYQVFKDIVAKLGILQLRCCYDADREIANLANYFKCPILSNDNDFYVFDIKYGYIRTNDLKPQIFTKTENSIRKKFLKCKVYLFEKFLRHYTGIDKSLLPLFSVLCGTDFINRDIFNEFFDKIIPDSILRKRSTPDIYMQLDKLKRDKEYDSQIKILKFLAFFKNLSWDESVNKIVSYLKEDQKEIVQEKINEAKNFYDNKEIHLLSFINNKHDASEIRCSCIHDENLNETENKTLNETENKTIRMSSYYGKRFPDWFVRKCHQTEYPPVFLNAASLHEVILYPQIENPNCTSSHDCSLSIRKILYGILTSMDLEDFGKKETLDQDLENNGQESSLPFRVKELCMSAGTLRFDDIEPEYTINDIKIPKLTDISSMNDQLKRKLILAVLEVNESFISQFSEKYQFIAATIAYLLRHSKIKKEFLYALLAAFIYFHEVKPLAELELSSKMKSLSTSDNSNEDVKISGLQSLVTPAVASEVNVIFKGFFSKRRFSHTNVQILEFIHSYSQFQSVVLHAMYLNTLLGNALENPKVQDCFSGMFTFNISEYMFDPELFDVYISEIFAQSEPLCALFHNFMKALHEHLPPDLLPSIK